MRSIGKILVLCILAAFLICCHKGPPPTTTAGVSQNEQEAQQLVQNAQTTFQSFMADPHMGVMRDLLPRAEGVYIVPQRLKGAFIVGAQGGSGVLVKRTKDNSWIGPAFYTLGGASFGLQAGAESSEVVFLIMSQRGINAFMGRSLKLGADAGIAVGPMGIGASAATANLSADILAFNRNQGLYGGLALSGAVIEPRESLNIAYYGKNVTPAQILVNNLTAPKGSALLKQVATASRESSQPKAKQAPR